MTPTNVPAAIPVREIKPINAKDFGKGGELKEKLMGILRDVPALHERLKKAIESAETAAAELKASAERATAIVNEWDKLNKENS